MRRRLLASRALARRAPRLAPVAVALVAATVAALTAPGAARADGAFPDAAGVLLPAGRPGAILLATNFGLLVTDDGGATWRWVCEEVIGPYAALYQIGPPPARALYARTTTGLALSSDGDACHWSHAGGALDGALVLDGFPDPVDGGRVLAIAQPSTAGVTGPMGVYPSSDGGRTFGAALFVAPAEVILTGVEVARAAPATLYLTGYRSDPEGGPLRPLVIRSTDGGTSFRTVEHGAALGPWVVRLAAVDPVDPRRLYLRVIAAAGDALALSDDGGETARVALPLESAMSAFVRRADGTLLVGTREGKLYRSSDGGDSFSRLGGAPRLRGLAERDGVLYAAADNESDGFALARSEDAVHWTPLLRYQDLCGLVACPEVADLCAGPWQALVARYGIRPGACGGARDGGAVDAGSASDAAVVPPPPPPRGCGCSVGGRAPAGPLGLALGLGLPPLAGLLAGLIAGLIARGRRRRGRGAAGGRDGGPPPGSACAPRAACAD